MTRKRMATIAIQVVKHRLTYDDLYHSTWMRGQRLHVDGVWVMVEEIWAIGLDQFKDKHGLNNDKK